MRIYRKFFPFIVALAFAPLLLLVSCQSTTNPVTDGSGTGTTTTNVTVTGTVLDSTGLAIDSALVRINYGTGIVSGYSGTTGKFSLSFLVDTNRTVTIYVSKTSFVPDTIRQYVIKNATTNCAPFTLSAVTTVTKKSGRASAIYLLSQTASAIGIQNSGSALTASLTFQVVDSVGNPIDASHSTLVKFSFGGHPNGGEYLSPKSGYAYTDTSGQVSVTLTSGTVAGVVQIIAQSDLPDKTVTSSPVSLTIFGGLPNQDHLGIAAQYLNFPGYDIYGLKDVITAYLGDKYGNPVRPGTAVYFSTTGGIIEGSALSSNIGAASANLMSASPRPVHPTRGAGFATVSAYTADENSQTISTTMDILFSGVPIVTITPSTFDIPNAGSQEFTYEIKDENGNPLAPQTNITITVTGDNVKTTGETNFQLPDTQSKAYTKFKFLVYDAVDTVNVAKPISIKILSTGPNGNAQLTINGISR
jgi:hypothetical protein